MAEHSGSVRWGSLFRELRWLTQVPQCLDLLCYAQALVVVDAWLLGLLVVGVIVFLLPQITLECHKN
jgi:hypothetical protein